MQYGMPFRNMELLVYFIEDDYKSEVLMNIRFYTLSWWHQVILLQCWTCCRRLLQAAPSRGMNSPILHTLQAQKQLFPFIVQKIRIKPSSREQQLKIVFLPVSLYVVLW